MATPEDVDIERAVSILGRTAEKTSEPVPVRAAACLAIGRFMPRKSAIDILERVLGTTSNPEGVRVAAAQGLGKG